MTTIVKGLVLLVLATAAWVAWSPTLPAAPSSNEEDSASERLADFNKSYLGGSKRWELFRDLEIQPSGGGRRGGAQQRSELQNVLRSWLASGGVGRGPRGRGGPGGRGPGGRGGPAADAASKAVEEVIAAIRQAAQDPQPSSLGPKALAFADILEIFNESAKSASVEDIRGLLEAGSLTDRLPPGALKKMDDRRPKTVELEASRALARIPPNKLVPVLLEVVDVRASGKSAYPARKGLELLGEAIAKQGNAQKSIDEVADLCILGMTESREPLVQLAAVAALRHLSEKHGDFRLGDERRDTLLRFVEKKMRKAPETVSLVVLRLLGDHPHAESIERLARYNSQASGLEERVEDTLWQTLDSITPASIARDAGKDAWLEWWEREKDEPRLAHWLSENTRGARQIKDPDYAESKFYGIPIVGKTVVFVIDVSGSMREPLGGTRGDVKMDGAKKELIKALEGLAEESRFNIVTFSQDVDVWQKNPVKVKSHRKAGIAMVESLQPLASTNLHGGLIAGFGMMRADRRAAVTGLELPDQIILLSDGNATVGELTAGPDILADVNRVDPARITRIDTIALGRGADRRFLGELAERYGGKMADIQ